MSFYENEPFNAFSDVIAVYLGNHWKHIIREKGSFLMLKEVVSANVIAL
jgi:hypothetical protein